MEIYQFGLQGLVAYGAVGAITLILKKRFHTDLDSDVKMYLLIGIAFAVGFVPADLGTFLFTQLKNAIAIGLGVNGLNTGIKKLSGTE